MLMYVREKYVGILHIPIMSWILLLRMKLSKKKGSWFKVDVKKSVKVSKNTGS